MPELVFAGKAAVTEYHRSLPVHQLIPVAGHSSTGCVSLDDNLIIEGDNLLALKALFPRYRGRVDLVYIDPPYNTGTTSWVFNDNVDSPALRKWLGRVVQENDLSRHDKWLCMMTPRLQLLKDLLSPDGVICISIDLHEQHHLTCLMNEIFGEENYREAILVRRGMKSVQAQFETIGGLSNSYETVLVYSRNPRRRFNKVYESLPESRPGTWNNHWRGTERPSMRFPLFGITPERGQWRWGYERSMEAVHNYQRMLGDLALNGTPPTRAQIDAWYLQQ
ncbi:MAG: site-specific DNA-methyltransferase, partial [Ignavibacteria bacterium]|nr:site-specific DNA-methyltransferase [Ignavibacteria bacterium]